MSEDNDLATRVRASLQGKRAELAFLFVDVESGTVRLSGRVPSFHLRQLAISAAKHVAGVRHVIDGIETGRKK
jgi:osmotically-inducible protein OsmY